MQITLKNLHVATAQQVFDQVSKHLMGQGCKSINHKGNCVYKGDGGDTSCAAGCLIADNEYKPELEGKSWKTLIAKGEVSGEYSSLISYLQIPTDCWKQYLIKLGKEYDLLTNREWLT